MAQLSYVNLLSSVDTLYKYLGVQVSVNEISKEKFCRKKYMVVFRLESLKVREIMIRFPGTLNMLVRNGNMKIKQSSVVDHQSAPAG